MKKSLLWYLLLLFPLSVSAQNQTLLKGFEKKVLEAFTVVKVNDHVNVTQVLLENYNFELVAVDEKMQVLWRTPLMGKPIGCGNFSGHLLAVASVNSSKAKDAGKSYLAYFVDEQTGKLIQQKEIYTSAAATLEVTEALFDEKGTWFKLVVRETASNRSKRFVSQATYDKTNSLAVIDINNKLDVTITKPNVPDGYYAGCAAGSAESFLLFVLQPDGTLKVSKFDSGKAEPSASITQSLDIKAETSYDLLAYKYTVSSSDPDVAYFSLVHKNLNRDYELSVCKLDFNTNSGKIVNEVLTKDHLKSIEKNFSTTDKKIDHPDMGAGFLFVVKHLEVYDGVVLVSFEASFGQDHYAVENATILNAYDKDLNLKFQQVLPNITVHGLTSAIAVDYYHSGNNLYLIANTGNMKFYTLYGQLDLASGKWIKLQRIEKEKIDSSDYTNDRNLWYKDGFILIYMPFTNGLLSKVDLSLQLNAY